MIKRNQIVLSIALLISGTCLSYGQKIELIPPAQIDSISRLIEKQQENDREKVRLLNEYARLNFYNMNFQEGFNATIEARNLSQKLSYNLGEAYYYQNLAAFTGRHEIYEYYLVKAEQIAENESLIPLNFPEGYPHDNLDSLIIVRLDPVYTHYEPTKELEIKAAITDRLCWSNYWQGNYDELYSGLRNFIKIYEEIGENYPIGMYYMNLSSFAGFTEGIVDIEALKEEFSALLSRTDDVEEIKTLYHAMATFYNNTGQTRNAIEYFLKSIEYLKQKNNLSKLSNVYESIHDLYAQLEFHTKAIEARKNQIAILEQLNDTVNIRSIQGLLVWDYYNARNYDEARLTINKLIQTSTTPEEKENFYEVNNSLEGQILMDRGYFKEAIPIFIISLEICNQWSKPWVAKHLAVCYYNLNDYETALNYSLSSIEYSKAVDRNNAFNKQIYQLVSSIYDAMGNKPKAYDYLKMYHQILLNEKEGSGTTVAETLMESMMEQSQKKIDLLEEEALLKEQKTKTQRLWIISIVGALLSTLLILVILYRNNKNKQKANKLLQQQKDEIQTTLEQLKATQTQLIQSEKMASLGELTAGIAHEIQNPLNFVNNFSEVNSELIDEMNDEIDNENFKEIKAIATDLKINEQKINHHGKRAESIVKGMLLHSRGSSGQKEPTDLNALCDEYLRLSYHGFRAKDKGFTADFKLLADENLPKIEVVQQDIGRVLLNLINNAFYACSECLKNTVDEKGKQDENTYQPQVVVITRKTSGNLEIIVKDNGSGIPDSIKAKIFQPFFTTKPTGSGTGLGLSLSYDIIKAHKGKLEVKSELNKGTEFIIQL